MTHSILLSGCGGAGRHVAQVATVGGRAAVTGLFDPNVEHIEAVQQLYPHAATGDDLQKLIERTSPDIVVVAGPDHLHAEQTLLALAGGCHVLVEKPMATTVADAERVIEAAHRTGLQVMADHTVRYMYPWREMSMAARAGEIGEIFFIQGDYIHDMWSHYSPQGANHTPWRIDLVHPQNILLGGGCHPIDIIIATVDSPVAEVFAYGSKKSAPDFPADDCYVLILKFENGTLGKVYVTSGCSGEGMEHGAGGGFLAVYGTEGTLWKGQLYRRSEQPVTLPDTSTEAAVGGHGWGKSVIDFLDAVDGIIPNPIPARVGARTVAICEAAFVAIETGQPQTPKWFS
jgi:predicted dehydrogenase